MSSKMVTGSSSLEPVVHGLATFSFAQPAIYNTLPEILQMNPKPASMFAFPRPSCKTDARC
jgi:hypothetical protein